MQLSLELVKLTIGPGATDDKQTPWKRPVLPYAIVRYGRSVRYITVAKAGSAPYNKSGGSWFYANYKDWRSQDQKQQEDMEFTWKETVTLDIDNEVTNVIVEVYNFRFRERDVKMGSFTYVSTALPLIDCLFLSMEYGNTICDSVADFKSPSST